LGPTKLTFTAVTKDDETVTVTYIFFSISDVNAEPLGIDVETDTDNDGISDYAEGVIGTDPEAEDTDNDGIPDSVELFFGFTQPDNEDSDGNGVLDGDEDIDNDGLTYREEIEAGTLFISEDTDGDGLSDGDEVKLYKTDPLNCDTDSDGVSDYEEVMLGKDPNKADNDPVMQTAEFEIETGDDAIVESVDISFESEHYLPEYVTAENILDKYVPCTNVVGRVGAPVNFTSYLDFDTATVTFHYNEDNLGDTNEENLGVLWFDEENCDFVMQEQAVVDTQNNTVTMEVTHFSKYVMIDVEQWNLVWQNAPDYTTDYASDTERYDYIIMIECTAYMTSAYKQKAIETAQTFINGMRTGERITFGIIMGEQIRMYTLYFTDKSLSKRSLTSLMKYTSSSTSYSMGSVHTGVVNLLNSTEDIGNIPVVINITSNINMSYGYDYTDYYNENGVRMYAVILGLVDGWVKNNFGGHYNLYERLDCQFDNLMMQTDGYMLTGDTAAELHEDFMMGFETDSDSDGIPDIYEEVGLTLCTGERNPTDVNSADSNDDGYEDWLVYGFNSVEKMFPTFRNLLAHMLKHNGIPYVNTCENPNLIDNDKDGLYDHVSREIDGEEFSIPIDDDIYEQKCPPGLLDKIEEDLDEGINLATELNSALEVPCSYPGIKRNMSEDEAWEILKKWCLDKENWCAAASFLGCFTLGFMEDTEGIAAHSDYYQLQRAFGYCGLYDEVFKIATNNRVDIFYPGSFNYNDEEYIFWGWRGYYLNLGTGAEMGVYYDKVSAQEYWESNTTKIVSNHYVEGGLKEIGLYDIAIKGKETVSSFMRSTTYICDWWHVAPYEFEMSLSLYYKPSAEKSEKENYESVYNWFPKENQWWITGFRYDSEWISAKPVETLYYICNVSFNNVEQLQTEVGSKKGMYNAFTAEINKPNNEENKFIAYNEDSFTVVWGDY